MHIQSTRWALTTLGLFGVLLVSTACTHRYRVTAPSLPDVDPGQYTKDDYNYDVNRYTCATEGVLHQANSKPGNKKQSKPGNKAKSKSDDKKDVPNDDSQELMCTSDTKNKPDVAKQARNNIAYGLMTLIDVVYGNYYNYLFTAKGTGGVAGDALTLGLSAASTITTHAATKTILSALGTAFAGVSLSLDKNFFAQQTFPVIGVAMQTRRDTVRATIVANLSLDTTQYPLLELKRDLVQYYNAGTLASGLQELYEEAGSKTAAMAAGGAKAPSAPSGLVAAPGDSLVNLTWVAPAGATSYNLYYSTNEGVTTSNGTLISNIQTNSYTHSALAKGVPLKNGTPYYYIVTAVNSDESTPSNSKESAASNQVSATPTAPGPSPAAGGAPSAPVGLSAAPGNSQVNLIWAASAGADYYKLYYSITPGDPKAKGSQVPERIKALTYIHSTDGGLPLKNGTPYFYVVTAVNEKGEESRESNQVSVTPSAPPAVEQVPKQTPH